MAVGIEIASLTSKSFRANGVAPPPPPQLEPFGAVVYKCFRWLTPSHGPLLSNRQAFLLSRQPQYLLLPPMIQPFL